MFCKLWISLFLYLSSSQSTLFTVMDIFSGHYLTPNIYLHYPLCLPNIFRQKRYTYINYAKILTKNPKKGLDKNKTQNVTAEWVFPPLFLLFLYSWYKLKKVAWNLSPEDEGYLYFFCLHVIRFKNDRKKLGNNGRKLQGTTMTISKRRNNGN